MSSSRNELREVLSRLYPWFCFSDYTYIYIDTLDTSSIEYTASGRFTRIFVSPLRTKVFLLPALTLKAKLFQPCADAMCVALASFAG